MDSLIEIQNVTKKYKIKKGAIHALKGVSFTLYQGEIMSLLGVNGAGKTTLSSIIATLHPPTSGDIIFEGQSIYNNVNNFRLNIGYCPQKPNLNPFLTLEENLLFAGRFYGMQEDQVKERVTTLMKQFDLTKYAQEHAMILSGGYKQRFSIARSLIHNPKLVLLDEPTVGLDPQVRHSLWKHIKAMKEQGVTVLLTTHYLDEAEELSDRVCILDKGVVKLIERPENLKKQFKQERLEQIFIQLTDDNNNNPKDT